MVEDRNDFTGSSLVRGQEGDYCSVWEETEIAVVGYFVCDIYPGGF